MDSASALANGCLYANAGLVTPSHVGPLATPGLLAQASRQLIKRPPAVRIVPDRSH